jgi:hypothetical protein
MKLARRDDLLQRFDWRVTGDKIGVERRFKFVEMNADVGGYLPAIEIWGVELDYRRARLFVEFLLRLPWLAWRRSRTGRQG